MNQAPQNDNIQFSDRYEEVSQLVKRTVARYRLDFHTAQDLEQECMIKIWRYFDTYRSRNSQAAWVVTVTKNICIDHLRSRKIHETLFDDTVERSSGDKSFRLQISAPSNESAKDYENVLSLIPSLIKTNKNPIRREVAERFYVDGDSVFDICQEMKLNKNTVTSHLRRFRMTASKKLDTAQNQEIYQMGPSIGGLSAGSLAYCQ
ncbi:MAG: sigma-70 family RNA polymerase sigma factor [Pseudobacteriovorax sp.]|nr:sigma-70 family RNA polymerase sigma factor [Pseudobacteriovorax sp.]